MGIFTATAWSPYVVGGLIGLLNIAALLLSNKPLSASTTYLKVSGMIRKIFQREKVQQNEYYGQKTPEVDWGVMMVFGIILGSFLSASLSGDFQLTLVPEMWAANFSDAFLPRFITALFGGIILGIGARWAGGCTSGHGISGASQLSIISWVAAIAFFIGGIITALIKYSI
jgi:uncharacterized protein